MNPKEIINLMASTCNCSILYASGAIRFKMDKPRTAVAHFNMDNIVKGSFKVQKNSWSEMKINRIGVQFQDKDNDYERNLHIKMTIPNRLSMGLLKKF